MDDDVLVSKFLTENIAERELVCELSSGHHLGARAFDEFSQHRVANVYAKRGTHLLIISKAAYQYMIK